MTKVAIVTDNHWGVRGSSPAFAKNQSEFWKFFWQEFDKSDAVAILHGGDGFDKRKSIDFLTLANAKADFFDPALERNVPVHMIVGNHCIYYKNTNKLNSLELLLSSYPNVHVIYDEPKTIDIDGYKIDMVPWFHHELHTKTIEFMKNSSSPVMLGHLELKGFEFHRGIVNKHGFESNAIDRYQMVLSGHYHTRSQSKNVTYLGATSEYTWSDYNDPRGFHFLDLHTLELDFIQNHNYMFYRIVAESDDIEVSHLSGKIVRLIQGENCSSEQFQNLLDKIRAVNPEELDAIERNEVFLIEDNDIELDETIDTIEYIKKEVESIEDLKDKDEILSLLVNLYQESNE